MSSRTINIALLLLLCIAGILAWTVRKDPARPNFEIFPDMARQARYNSFAPAAVFADGKVMREPPAHSIPRGFLPFRYEATEEDAARAGRELANPHNGDDTNALRRGARVFATFCQPCHGAKGAGDGLVVARGYPAPPPLARAETAALPDGTMFHIITRGKGNMPPHASQISEDDRWKAVVYIRSLQP